MPYVNVPNDLSKIKTKIAFNLTRRQLISYRNARENIENNQLQNIQIKIGNAGLLEKEKELGSHPYRHP